MWTVRNCKKGRLSAYKLDSPRKLLSIYNVFYVFILKQYRQDPSYIIQKPKIENSGRLAYVKESIEILD